MITDKTMLQEIQSDCNKAHNMMSNLYEKIMLSNEFTVDEKLQFSLNFQKILWNLDDLVYTFNSNKP